MTGTDLGGAYRAARHRVSDLIEHASPEQLALVVPATPKWTVHEVVCHLAGVTADVVDGRLDGAPGEAWTERHVAERRDLSTASVLARWAGQAVALEASDAVRVPFVADIASHEQDLRAALSSPGARDNSAIAFTFPPLFEGFCGRVERSGLPSVRAETDAVALGADDAPVVLRAGRYELYRAMTGRRSEAQVRALGWSGAPDPYLDVFSIFAFPPSDLTE
jgi:hypothetical protein